MKKALQLSKLALLASLFCLNACNNDLVLVEGYKEIPIVYGFLTLADTATYIRVEKAYADPKRSATEVAQIPDSLYYADATVTLVRVRNNERFALKKVDGNTEGYPRNGGTFAKSPNYLYKIKTSTLAMKADEDWRVEIARVADSKILAKATTRVIGDYSVFTPSVTPALFLTYDNTFTVGVETAEASAKIYAINIVFNYDETDPTKPNSTVSKSVKWQFSSSSSRTGSPAGGFDQQYFRRASKDFFEFLGTAISETAGLTRKFTSLDVEVTAGGQELIDYVTVGIANLGITGSQTIPTYTNITDGLGIFTSRSKTVKKGLPLNDQTLEVLKSGDLTKKLNFR